MRVHPEATKLKLEVCDGGEDKQPCMQMEGNSANKKLRRLPHVFSKVLELPFRSDIDVIVDESPEFIRFVAEIEVGGGGDVRHDVRAIPVEIHPGVTKVVLRSGGCCGDEVELPLDKLHVDMWRFRLPAVTRPELATASLVGGELIVTVPKVGGKTVEDELQVWGAGGRLILVQ